jgi:hypothetical protein
VCIRDGGSDSGVTIAAHFANLASSVRDYAESECSKEPKGADDRSLKSRGPSISKKKIQKLKKKAQEFFDPLSIPTWIFLKQIILKKNHYMLTFFWKICEKVPMIAVSDLQETSDSP